MSPLTFIPSTTSEPKPSLTPPSSYASTDQMKEIVESGLQLAKVFASRSPINAELLKDADFRKADITFIAN